MFQANEITGKLGQTNLEKEALADVQYCTVQIPVRLQAQNFNTNKKTIIVAWKTKSLFLSVIVHAAANAAGAFFLVRIGS